jgi:serine protease
MSGPLNHPFSSPLLLKPKALNASPLAIFSTGDRASNLDVVTNDNTIATARDLGVVDRPIILRDFVGGSDGVDLYKFELVNGSRTQITLDELSGDADIQLIQDANGNGRIETNEILRRSEFTSTNPDVISLASLAMGEYYIRVQSYQGDTNYRLSLDAIATDTGGTIPTASELGIVTGRKVLPGTLSNSDNADVYQFQLLAQSDLQIDLTGLTSNADLYLTQDRNGNGVFDVGETITQSLLPGNQSERISVNNLAAGRYLVFVGQTPNQLQATSYGLAITADSAGESFAQASYLGGFSNDTTTIREFVGAPDPIDFYRFRLNTMGEANITLSDLSGDADLVLYQDLNRNGVFDTGERLGGSYTVGRQNENITISGLAAGEYLIGVFSLVGEDTNYRLNLTTTARSPWRSLSGTLGADTFRLDSAAETVISGNGNYAFGQNRFDILDLSNFSSQNASFNLLNINGGTGVTLDLGRGTSRYDQIQLSNGQMVSFQGIDRIVFSDRKIDLAKTPNDPLFSRQWNLHMMGVQNAWRLGTGSDRIVLGIADTGLGFNDAGMLHPDLRTRNLTVVDRTNISDDYYEYYGGILQEYDSHSHGTEVQGIITATSDNNRGIAGINWNSRVIAADVLGGNRGDLTVAEGAAPMIQSLRSGERLIINLSLGGGPLNPELEALVAAHQDDVLFVVASGNENASRLSQPAALAERYDNVIAVGAVWGELDALNNRRQPGTRLAYSGTYGSNYGDGLTLMGPTEVLSTDADRPEFFDTQFQYNPTFGGTSAATPNVAGVASLAWSINPNLTARQVKQILSNSTVDLGAEGYDRFTGHGFINADAAVRGAIAYA